MLRGSPDRFVEIVESLGEAKVNDIVFRKVTSISKNVYDDIERENLFRASQEQSNIREYIIEVLEEVKRENDKVGFKQHNGRKNNDVEGHN